MQDAEKYERVHEYSPDRCQQNVTIGSNQKQCNLKKVPGSNYCQIHGGNKIEEKQRLDKLNMYRLTKYQIRLNEFKGANEVKNLKDEIGILRIILEETLNTCNSAAELVAYSDKVSTLAGQIERLVSSSHKLELSLGQYLDKTQALNLIEIILSIINSSAINDTLKESISSNILDKCTESIQKAQREIMKGTNE